MHNHTEAGKHSAPAALKKKVTAAPKKEEHANEIPKPDELRKLRRDQLLDLIDVHAPRMS